MSELRGADAGQDPEVYELNPDEWKDTTEEVAEKPESEPTPEEPAPLISPENADTVVDNKQEREKFAINYVEQARQRSIEEIAERYKISEGNVLSRFIKQTKAVFAGEYSDLKISERVADAKPEEQAKELKKAFRLLGRDGALRLGKIGVKTGVAGGIGAGIAAILGGTVGSPVFLAALAGGAAARGAFELYRHFKKDEREGRTKVIESRSKVFAEAARLQDQAVDLVMEREEADEERRVEIDKQLAELHQYFIDLTHYESYQALYGENKVEKELSGLAETQRLGYDKMRLEKKREKVADIIAAGGSILGGLGGYAIQESLLNADIDKVRGVWADFDKDGIQHFVEKINPSDIASADPGFAQQLEKTGGFVFNYNGGTAAAEFGVNKAAEVTTAVLNNGSEVHVLSGLNDSIFRNLIVQNNPELAERAAALAGSFWKEAVPIAGAQLQFLAEFFSSVKKSGGEPKATESKSDDNRLALPGGEAKALPMRKKPEESGVDKTDGEQAALNARDQKELPAGENGKNLPVRWAEKDTTGHQEILEGVEEDISKAFLEAYNEKGDKKVEPESSDAASIVEDVEKLYSFGASELDEDTLNTFGITMSKTPAPDGRSVTSIFLKNKDNFSQSIKLEYPEPEYDREGRPLPNPPKIVLGRTDSREKDGWKVITNPSSKEVTALLNEIVDRFEDANAKKQLQKEEPVPITVNGQPNINTVRVEANKSVEENEASVKFEDIAQGDVLFLRVPEGDSSRIGTTVLRSGEKENGLVKITVDRVDSKRQTIVTKVGKIAQPFVYSTIESMVVGRNLESSQSEEVTEQDRSPTEEENPNHTQQPEKQVEQLTQAPEPEPESESEPDKELYDLITEAGKTPDDFAEGQSINFSEAADNSEQAAEIKEALNIPRSQKLSETPLSILMAEGVGEPETIDFNITLMRDEGDQQYDHTISLRELIKLIK